MKKRKYRIGLELTALHTSHRTRGAGRVAQAYLEGLSAHPDFDILPYSRGDFPSEKGAKKEEWSDRLWDRWRLIWAYKRMDLDLIQIIDPMKTPPFSSVPVVGMVHDLIPYHYRERYQTDILERYLYWRMKRQIKSSDKIITPSRSTADDLVMSFGMDKKNIETIHHGIDHQRFYPRTSEEIQTVCDEYDIDRPYFLMVADLSSFDPCKNLEEVVENWDHRLFSDIPLVIAGKKGEYSDILQGKWQGRDDLLIFTDYVNDGELACLYSGARLLLFPSRHEGFGFPILEAMACGTRPVVRDVGSIREIVDAAAFRLEDNEYAQQFQEIIAEEIKGPQIDESCVKHAKKFTWKKAITQAASLYKELI